MKSLYFRLSGLCSLRILFIALPCLLPSSLAQAQVSNNAGVLALTEPAAFCAGTYNVKVNIANNGNNKLDSVRINWSIDGNLQTPVHYTNPIDTSGSAGGNIKNVTLGSVNFTTGIKKSIKIWTSHPNGVADLDNKDDTLFVNLRTALSGNYSISGTGADYSSFTAAVSDLNTYGICGTVNFSIAAGTYKERLVLTKINGSSATSTITFNGGNKANTILEYNGASVNDWQTILLNGASYVTIKNLTIKAIDNTYAIGVHLVNANNNTIDSCDIVLEKSSSATNLFGIAGSGSTTDATSAGKSGDNNTFSNLSISGGYYGIRYTGASATQLSTGNKFLRNNIIDFYEYGCYLYALAYTTIDGNKISSRSSALGLGIYLDALASFTCIKNNIHSGDIGLYIQYGNYYQHYKKGNSLIANNMVITAGSTAPFLNFKYSRHIDFYHNSFLSSSTYGVYMENVDSTNIRNNIFTNMGSNGTVLYSTGSAFSATYELDDNIYYAPNCPKPVYWDPAIYNSLTFWFTWGGNNMNSNSFELDPQFTSSTNLHLKNGNNPKGPDLGIIDDIDGKPRCAYGPTIGASEIAKGSRADSTKPVNICVGDTLQYMLFPPSGLSNSDYGTKWSIDSLKFETAGGTPANNLSIVYPSSSGNGLITFYPTSVNADSSYFLDLAYLDFANQDCDSTFGTYIKVYPKPKAEFSVNKIQVCLGDSFTFTNSSTVSPSIKYLWIMGDGEVVNKTSFTYLYKQGGIYHVKLVAYTPACSDTFTKTLVVGSSEAPGFAKGAPFNGYLQKGTLADPDNLCVGDTATYDVLSPFGFFNYHYNTYWRVSNVILTPLHGSTPLSDTMTMTPDSINNFKVRFIATGGLSGDTVAMKVTLSSMVANNCDTVMTRYLAVGYAPKAAFGFTPQCFGEGPVIFHDSSSIASGLIAKTWDFGDGTTTSSTFVSHTYSNPGKYTVKLTVISAQGCTDFATRVVEISELPKVNFSFQPQCTGTPVSFLDSTVAAGNITSRLWKFGDGTTDTSENPFHAFKTHGEFDVKLIITTSSGCRDSVTKNIMILEKPVADFKPAEGCINEPVSFTNLSKGPVGAALMHTWDFGDEDTSNTANPNHFYSKAGKYNVSLITIASNGCSDTITKEVTLHDVPKVAFGLSTSPACEGVEIEFTDSSAAASASSYHWNFGDGTTSADKVGKHTYNKTGTYDVKLRISTVNGCSDSTTIQINVLPQPIADFKADNVCQNDATQFTNTSSSDTGAVYAWDFGDGMSSADKNPSHTYANAGTYKAKLTVTNPKEGCENILIKDVKIMALPTASFTISHISAAQKQFKPSDTTLLSYLWYFGDGDSSGAMLPTHRYNVIQGAFTVKLIAKNKEGCTNESTEYLTIDATGIQDKAFTGSQISVYPNPFTGHTQLYLELEETAEIRIMLTDAVGKEIAILDKGKRHKGSYTYEINAPKLNMSGGIYILRMSIGERQFSSRIFLKH